MIRLLREDDYIDYTNLLRQLSNIGEITEQQFRTFFYEINMYYKIYVYELDDKVVGCLTLLVEKKLGRNVLHIEDVVTDTNYRGKGISSELIEAAKKYSTLFKCYKIILDCNDSNVVFYEKNGFKKSGNQMRFDF